MKKITILGTGILGSAISNIASANGNIVTLYSNDLESINEINEKHTNSRYTNCRLNEKVTASGDLTEAARSADCIFIILPSKVVGSVLTELKNKNINFTKKFVIFSKGIDGESGKFFSQIVSSIFSISDVAVLSGPNFAEEIIEQRFTITTVATKNKTFFDEIKQILSCNYFKIEYFDDPMAVQLSGLVKNVLAILCGISEGLNLGRNTFTAIMMKGIEEINNLCQLYGFNKQVVSTSACIGDIVLTCSSQKSRNMSFGFRIGSGEKVSDILASSNSVIEGLSNADNLEKMAEKVGVISIANAAFDIVNNNYSREELINAVLSIFK
jgi:glycerol-3-phosphate dehydrogenase (NAD(P)+)